MKSKEKYIIASALLSPPDNSGAGERICNYLLHFTRIYNIKTLLATSSDFTSSEISKQQYLKFSSSRIFNLFIWFPLSLLKSLKLVYRYPKASFLLSSAKCPISVCIALACIFYNRKYIIGTTLYHEDDEDTLRESILSPLYKLILAKSDTFILQTPLFLTSNLKSVAPNPLVVPNGIPLPRSNNLPFEISKTDLRKNLYLNDRITLLQIGRVSKRKNTLETLHLIKHLVNSGHDLSLIILGPFDPINCHYCSRCQKYVDMNNLSSFVFFNGYVESPTVYYQMADIYLSSSLNEGLPNALLEAMSFSLPVVHRELLVTSEYILGSKLVDELCYKTIKSANNIISELIVNKSLRIMLGKECYKRMQKFDIDNIMQIYSNILLK